MTGKIRPVSFRRHKNAMVVNPRYRKVFEAQFAEGEDYVLVPLEERDMKSHGHYFATLHEGWLNLDEKIAHRWPTETHLRRWALIETGFYNLKTIPCDSPSQAKRFAALCRGFDAFAVILVRGDVVEIYTARSQSAAPPPVGMGPEDFKASKKAVLDLVATLARTDRKSLEAEAAGGSAPEAERRPIEGGSISERAMAARDAPEKETPPSEPLIRPPPSIPKVASEYADYFRALLQTAGKRETAMALWNAEEALRADLGVTSPVRRELAKEIVDLYPV
jgi:hypothetical protein